MNKQLAKKILQETLSSNEQMLIEEIQTLPNRIIKSMITYATKVESINPWISVEETLPDNPNKENYKLSDIVLVHVEYEPYKGNYHTTTSYYDYNDNKWKEIDGKWAEQEVGTRVTYWMELPKPPTK